MFVDVVRVGVAVDVTVPVPFILTEVSKVGLAVDVTVPVPVIEVEVVRTTDAVETTAPEQVSVASPNTSLEIARAAKTTLGCFLATE